MRRNPHVSRSDRGDGGVYQDPPFCNNVNKTLNKIKQKNLNLNNTKNLNNNKFHSCSLIKSNFYNNLWFQNVFIIPFFNDLFLFVKFESHTPNTVTYWRVLTFVAAMAICFIVASGHYDL